LDAQSEQFQTLPFTLEVFERDVIDSAVRLTDFHGSIKQSNDLSMSAVALAGFEKNSIRKFP
jgi:hypothetical protein